jgi:NAD(P)-dependent dehydrogenase (short-subunit alcohol dehydrogenase family)
MFDDLRGKAAVITGAGAGIGLAYATALCEYGVHVALVDQDDDAVTNATASLVAAGHRAVAVAIDVSDEAAVQRMVDEVGAAFGRLDILVNNAALHLDRWSRGAELPVADWRRIMDVNVIAPVACAVACRPHLARRNGVIVNQSSVAAYHGAAGAYSVSKLALNGVTMTLAREFGADGIRVNGIAPGFIASPAALTRVTPANRDRVQGAQSIAREGQMADLVGALLYLVSDASSFVTGHTITVDGGAAMRP